MTGTIHVVTEKLRAIPDDGKGRFEAILLQLDNEKVNACVCVFRPDVWFAGVCRVSLFGPAETMNDGYEGGKL